MPVDMVVYTTVLTLIVFLLFKLPGVRQGTDFTRPAGNEPTGQNASAIAMEASGLLVLTIQFIMAPTHTIDGFNYADVWHIALSLIGGGLILSGTGMALYGRSFQLPGKRKAPESIR